MGKDDKNRDFEMLLWDKLDSIDKKIDRYSERTARYITRQTLHYICEKCIYEMKEASRKLLKDGHKWEGITIKC